ncbi:MULTISPECIES: hypothetical protein [unclassified Streptomyces]|uniref:hypothetical protein n=1 Tax=unclassified Streptomyces TaxID=2593676 RepID=UPI00382B7662
MASPDGPPTAWRDGLWLEACLRTIATGLGLPHDDADDEVYDRLVEHSLDGRLPTLLPYGHDEATRSAS